MDIIDAARYFDAVEARDAYDQTLLFVGQMDQYDSSERDSMTGWRRSCSAGEIVVPTRGVVAMGGTVYLTGRRTKDYFGEFVIREHLLLHPADGLFTMGASLSFIKSLPGDQTQFYGAVSLRKEQKEDGVSSQTFNVYNIYAALSENAERGMAVRGPDGVFYRIQNIETQTGRLRTFYASELGSAVLSTVGYTSTSGAYNPVTDSSGTADPIFISAFVERFQTNFHYLKWGAGRYRPGDLVVTVADSDVTSPAVNEVFTTGGRDYRILEVQPDDQGCWEIHVRPG